MTVGQQVLFTFVFNLVLTYKHACIMAVVSVLHVAFITIVLLLCRDTIVNSFVYASGYATPPLPKSKSHSHCQSHSLKVPRTNFSIFRTAIKKVSGY